MKKQFTLNFAGSTYPCLYIDNAHDAERVISRLLESKEPLIADCETAALPEWKHIQEAALSPHLARPRLIQMFTGKSAVVIDLYKTGFDIPLGKLFSERPSVFHNMNFDYKMLHKWYGVQYPDMHCTAIMARCCWQAMYPGFKSAALGDVAYALFGEEVIKKAGASDWSMPELTFEQVKYAANDVIILNQIYKKLSDMMTRLKLNTCYEIYRKAQIVISKMELNGFSFDKETHKLNIVSWRQKMADARDEVTRITGIQSITDTKIGEWLKKNLDEATLALWPRTEKNEERLAVGSDALVNFSHLEIVKPFSTFQKYKKLCTSFGTSLIDHINPATGKLHTSYFICGARTGRTSCSNPNLANQPRDKDMRRVYVASPGKELVAADYGQLEVRIIAELSKEEGMLQAFENGIDIYKSTIAGILGKRIEDITPEERQSGKMIVLGRSYALGRVKQAHYAKKNYGITLSEQENNKLFYGYRDLYPSLYKWQIQQADRCQANRFTCFELLGKANKLTEDTYFGASMNMPVQGGAASINYIALIDADKKLHGTSARFLVTVYDEIAVECDPDDIPLVKEVLTTSMTSAYSRLIPNARTLKNLVDPNHGANWAVAKGK